MKTLTIRPCEAAATEGTPTRLALRATEATSRPTQRSRPQWPLQVLWFAAALVMAPAQGADATDAPASPAPLRVSRATEIVDRWRPGQHLYVKGDVGVGETQLAQLQRWLADQAPNWTIALLESASDERFTDAAGESFSGMDAVEHALGKGLPNRTAFGALTDPRTQERNGAFFVLFLAERKFSYFASEAQDRRRLGEDQWLGELDQPAIAAMREGGRIVDAVRDTITNIETRLSRTIQAEQTERERRAAEARLAREREIEQARSALSAADQALTLLETKTRQLQQARPEATGDLGQTDLGALRSDLVAARSSLDADHPSAARALAENVRSRALDEARAIDEYLRAEPEFEAIARQLDHVLRLPHGQSALPAVQTARATLKDARSAYDRADRTYAQFLESGRAQAAAAENQVRAAAVAARRGAQLRVAGATGALLLLVALGVALNLRRRPYRRQALELLHAWSTALGEKSVALAELVDRAQTVLGMSSEDVAARFTDRTLELGTQAVRDVDEACIMSVCAQRIHRAADASARPRSLTSRLRNLFATGRYRSAIRQLRDEPIVFRPHEGLELAIRGPRTTRDRLLGPLESYQPFQMSFNELMEAFNQRSGRALSALDRITGSLSGLNNELRSLETRLRALKASEAQFAGLEPRPEEFRLRALFEALLPSAEADWGEAEQSGVRDPVGALERHAEAARRKCDEAEALVRVAHDFHREVRPALSTAAAQLTSGAVSSEWMEVAALDLSERAEALARQACEATVANSIHELAEDAKCLAERASQAVSLDQTRREQALPALETAQRTVAETRLTLAARLGLDPTRVLRESQCDPSERLAQAEEQTAAAKAALQRGDLEAAQASLDAAAALCAEATAITEATRSAFENHASRLVNCRAETERLAQSVPDHETMLSAILAGYPPSVLLLGQGDPTHPNANGTLLDNPSEVSEHLRQARQLSDRAAEVFRQGRVLEAAGLLDQATANQTQAGFRLAEIAEKHQRIRLTEAANDQQARRLTDRISALTPVLAEARTMRPTLAMFQAAQTRLAEATTPQTGPARDPFALALELAAIEADLGAAEASAARDRALHAEVEQALQSGAVQLEAAQRLVQTAATDRVTDSAAIADATRELRNLMAEHGALQGRLSEHHGDWLALEAQASELSRAVARVTSVLSQELQAAQAALASLDAAAAQVRSAGGWRGLLGVAIFGSPGADQLTQARTFLNQGAYQAAQQAAEAARQTALLAIAQAEAEQRRRQRAEQERRDRERREREEADRRRRQAARSSSFGSLSSGSPGSRRSGFSSSSGARRSSFSSGSGARRSGW